MENEFDSVRENIERQLEEEWKSVNKELDQDILFVLMGDVNAGKSSTINQLLDEEVAPVGSKPGETVEVKKYQYKDKLFFVDTPGLDDIQQANSEETWKYYKKADVILFFLNAAGTVFSDGEKQAFEEVQKQNQNIIIVLNKIDAAEDIPGLVGYIDNQTNHKYKIAPISSKTGENIDKLLGYILDMLRTKKKDLLFAKHVKNKSAVAKKWIISAGGAASAIGASPIPLSDMVPLTAIQVGLLARLASLYDKPLTKDRAQELILASITGNVGKTLFRQAIKVIPGAGSILGAGVAGTMTLALGYGTKYAYENNIELNVDTLKMFAEMFKKDKGIM